METTDIKALADAIFADKVRAARALPADVKMGMGPLLFQQACDRMRDGIVMQFPGISAEDVEIKLRQRLNRIRKLQEKDIYCPATRP